jgi:hypothetical protein
MSKKKKAVTDAQVVTPDSLVNVITDVIARLPEVPQVTALSTKYSLRLGRIDQRVVEASLSAIASSSAVQSALGRTKADVTQQSTDAVDWNYAIDTVGKMYAMLVEANRRRRQLVGLTALQTYGICKQLVREAAHAEAMTPHVDAMKRAMKKQPQKAPTQQPAPPPAPVKE